MAPPERDLTTRAARGLAVTYASVGLATVAQLAYAAVLSRILDPADFGLFALAGVVIRIAAFVGQFGIASAIVQRPRLDDEDVRSVFCLQLAISIVVASAVAGTASSTAGLLGDPDLAPVIQALALVLPINASGAVAAALLRRALRFAVVAAIEVGSFVVGFLVVGVALAISGAGIWSLVGAALCQSAVASVAAYATSRHPLLPRLRMRSPAALVGFGGKVTVIGLLEYVGQSADAMVIGRMLGVSAVGQYTKAVSLAMLPLQQLAVGVTKVLTASFSRVSERERAAAALESGSAMLLGVLLPVAASLAVLSDHLVPVLYGPGWQPAADVMPILVLAAALNMMSLMPAIVSEARADLNAKVAIQAGACCIFFVLLYWAYSTSGDLVAYGAAWVGTELFRYMAYTLRMRFTLGVSLVKNIRAVCEALLLAAIVAVSASLAIIPYESDSASLLLGSAASGAAYLTTLSMWRGSSLRTEVRSRKLIQMLPARARPVLAPVFG